MVPSGIVDLYPSRDGGVRPVDPSGQQAERSAAVFCNTLARLVPLFLESEQLYRLLVRRVDDETRAAFCHYAARTQHEQAERVRNVLRGMRASTPDFSCRFRLRHWLCRIWPRTIQRTLLRLSETKTGVLRGGLDLCRRACQEQFLPLLEALLAEELRQRAWLERTDNREPVAGGPEPMHRTDGSRRQ